MTEIIKDGVGIIAANYLSATGQKSINFHILWEIKAKLEIALTKKGYSIYIDTTRDSIINAFNNNTDIFDGSFEKQEIWCRKKKGLNESDMMYFNAKIPHAIREDFLKIMNDSISHLDPGSRWTE